MKVLCKLAIVMAVAVTCSLSVAADGWSPPQPVHADAAIDQIDDAKPQVTRGASEDFLAVWARPATPTSPGNELVASYKTSVSGNWSPPVTIHSGSATPFRILEIQLLYAGNSAWVCQWIEGDENTSTSVVRASRSINNGQTWSPAANLFSHTPTASIRFMRDLSADTNNDGKIISTWILPWTNLEFIMVGFLLN